MSEITGPEQQSALTRRRFRNRVRAMWFSLSMMGLTGAYIMLASPENVLPKTGLLDSLLTSFGLLAGSLAGIITAGESKFWPQS